MPSGVQDFRSLSTQARLTAQENALAALRTGQIVLAPGDTGYFLLVSPTAPGAETITFAGTPATLVLPSTADLLEAIPSLSLIARKVIRSLTPGPVVFQIQLSEAALAEARSDASLSPGMADAADALHVRVPGASIASSLAAHMIPPLITWEPTDAGGRTFSDAQTALAAASKLGIVPSIALADAPPTGGGSRHRPTVVALTRTGGVRVISEGAYEERYVLKHAKLNILMVCTGNTCRSPMAEAIAQGIIARAGADGPSISITSAGTGAAGGSPHTPEGNVAVKGLGYSPTPTRSRPLTRELIAEADLIYAMTHSNLAGVLAVDPRARDIAELLDPDGEDVPDPIGMPQQAYNDTAQRIESMILERLKEWRP